MNTNQSSTSEDDSESDWEVGSKKDTKRIWGSRMDLLNTPKIAQLVVNVSTQVDGTFGAVLIVTLFNPNRRFFIMAPDMHWQALI